MSKQNLKRQVSRGIRMDQRTHERLIILLENIKIYKELGKEDSLIRCLDKERYTVSSLIYCIVVDYLPTLEWKYRKRQ